MQRYSQKTSIRPAESAEVHTTKSQQRLHWCFWWSGLGRLPTFEVQTSPAQIIELKTVKHRIVKKSRPPVRRIIALKAPALTYVHVPVSSSIFRWNFDMTFTVLGSSAPWLVTIPNCNYFALCTANNKWWETSRCRSFSLLRTWSVTSQRAPALAVSDIQRLSPHQCVGSPQRCLSWQQLMLFNHWNCLG